MPDPEGYTPGGDEVLTGEWADLPATHRVVDDEWFPVDQVVADAGPPVVPPTLLERLARLLR